MVETAARSPRIARRAQPRLLDRIGIMPSRVSPHCNSCHHKQAIVLLISKGFVSWEVTPCAILGEDPSLLCGRVLQQFVRDCGNAELNFLLQWSCKLL